MSDRILKVALVGCGEVAQTVHLPTLLLCNHMYQTVAVCDISREAAEHCANKFHVAGRHTGVGEMLAAHPDIDLVLVINANEYHAIHAVQCLDAGKHVFIEKPMALSHEDAAAIEQARQRSGKVCFIGYMRRYASAFLRVKELIKGMDVKYVRVRDIIGSNAYFIEQGGHFPLKFTADIPEQANEERLRLSSEIHTRALGKERGTNKQDMATWTLLGGLASHDLSAMRELIGMPKRCIASTRTPDNKYITAMFEYEDFTAYYEMGIDDVKKFDAHIELYGKDKHVKVTYDTPYVKGLPITATVLSTHPNGDFSEETIRRDYEDAYTLEYRALYDAVVRGASYKTTPEDAAQELVLFDMIFGAFTS